MIRQRCQHIAASRFFERFIIALILINAVVLGLETVGSVRTQYADLLETCNQLILGVFIIEAGIKLTAVAPRFGRYFGDTWNLFDFSIIIFSLIPATGQFAMIARLARLLRVLRLISTVPKLRLIVSTLIRSLPSMGHVVLLMSVIFYIYAVSGYHLFHQHDPVHWGNLGLALLTLFRIVTLEDWTDVMYTAMELHPMAWIYFVSFVVVGTFVIVNLFIAVVLNNLDEAKHEQLEALRETPSHGEIIRELEFTRAALDRLRERIESEPPAPPSSVAGG
ncbi:MAG: ion transporter [Pseudomonadota bacterium]